MKVDIAAIQAAVPSKRIEMARTFILSGVEHLKPGADARERAQKLIDSLNAEPASSGGGKNQTATQKSVGHKLSRLKKLSHPFDAEQRRELLIIVIYGIGKLPIEQRKDAFALLQLWGDKESRALICAAFPGLLVEFARENQ